MSKITVVTEPRYQAYQVLAMMLDMEAIWNKLQDTGGLKTDIIIPYLYTNDCPACDISRNKKGIVQCKECILNKEYHRKRTGLPETFCNMRAPYGSWYITQVEPAGTPGYTKSNAIKKSKAATVHHYVRRARISFQKTLSIIDIVKAYTIGYVWLSNKKLDCATHGSKKRS